MTLTEGSIRIAVPANCQAQRFDGSSHQMSHCMKAVDFLIDTPTARILLEIKDPDAAMAPETSTEYAEKLVLGQLDTDLYYKYRDSWLYLYAMGRRKRVPHYYFVLLGLTTFTTESLAQRSTALQRKVSLEGPNGPWRNRFVDQLFVFNLESWNRSFPQLEAQRIG